MGIKALDGVLRGVKRLPIIPQLSEAVKARSDEAPLLPDRNMHNGWSIVRKSGNRLFA
jgi:hypothetical protein